MSIWDKWYLFYLKTNVNFLKMQKHNTSLSFKKTDLSYLIILWFGIGSERKAVMQTGKAQFQVRFFPV